MKSGIQEVADILAVTKADLPGADRVANHFSEIAQRPGDTEPRPVIRTAALNGDGVAELAAAIRSWPRPGQTRTGRAEPAGRSKQQTKAERLFDLTGRVAVVTGASGGLGRHFARVLHAAGATVIVGARRRDRLTELADELGERVIPVPCDITVESECDRLIDAAVSAGGLDVLVNNAGIGDVGRAEDESVEQFRGVVDLNLVSLFAMSQRAARIMMDRGSGSIVNIASALGLVASTPIKQAGYCASKGAVINLTRELAAQWGRSGVRVNALAPGWFRSEMTDGMFDDPKGQVFIERNTPLGRAGRADELDGALLFLATDASTYVLGQTIAVDGGWTIH
ncbi:SDR family oxidoreductase [Amycolatopsis echigonensis]|uniref:SDR family oxidoreductase n=2 Tax=Amycolatopsis echigonensis TaxID=2576905 RepID=A0A8E1VVW9_9PSEU|nr:SDR family oxidoreductase [Amycolatopsis echigonensis]